jgi:hypothetical protein
MAGPLDCLDQKRQAVRFGFCGLHPRTNDRRARVAFVGCTPSRSSQLPMDRQRSQGPSRRCAKSASPAPGIFVRPSKKIFSTISATETSPTARDRPLPAGRPQVWADCRMMRRTKADSAARRRLAGGSPLCLLIIRSSRYGTLGRSGSVQSGEKCVSG